MFQQLLANKHYWLRGSKSPIAIWPSGSLRLVTDKRKSTNKPRVEQEGRADKEIHNNGQSSPSGITIVRS